MQEDSDKVRWVEEDTVYQTVDKVPGLVEEASVRHSRGRQATKKDRRPTLIDVTSFMFGTRI